MAVGPDDRVPWVVGFSGVPVKGGAAMRSPLFEFPEGRYFLPNHDVTEFKSYSRPEVEEFVAGGYATLFSFPRKYRRIPGGVVLYAERNFVRPNADRCDLSLKMADLLDDTKLGMHIGYFARDEALRRLRTWGDDLLADANQCMRLRACPWDRAYDSASRARMTAPPPEHADLRRKAFIAMAVARECMGKDIEDVFHMVELDRNPALLAEVKMVAWRQITAVKTTQKHQENPRMPAMRKISSWQTRPLLCVGG